MRPEYVAGELEALDVWGTQAYGEAFIRSESTADHEVDPSMTRIMARASRHTATPDVARRLSEIWYDTDVRDVLPAVRLPTLLLQFERPDPGLEEATHVASMIRGLQLVVLPGSEADGEFGSFLDAESAPSSDRTAAPSSIPILSTVLFTDIVGSTQHQASLGDRRWKDLVLEHHAIVRESLERWRGVENDTAGDGFYATFDGPARAHQMHRGGHRADRSRWGSRTEPACVQASAR